MDARDYYGTVQIGDGNGEPYQVQATLTDHLDPNADWYWFGFDGQVRKFRRHPDAP